MARFSERIGVTQPKTVMQLGSMDADLRNGLWNVCYDGLLKSCWKKYFRPNENFNFPRSLWIDFFKLPIDALPHTGRQVLEFIRAFYFNKATWSDVYDFVEFLAGLRQADRAFTKNCNAVLERELSGYRFSECQLVPITTTEELKALERAVDLSEPYQSVRLHVSTAIDLFSDRKNPDYRNSIKEAISAVEAMCRIITGDEKATLGQALKRLEDKGIPLHRALKNSFSNLYGYTNDADGIRHALLEESTLDFEDAEFMLVSCSAFVNYLAAKAAKSGVAASAK
jgi:hypothetical protein